jgi:hypothetical protein
VGPHGLGAGVCESPECWYNVAKLESIPQPPTALGILTMIEESSAVFDELAAQWPDAYKERRHPLLAWTRQARETVLQ